ncbi:4-hydroxythreonine-4-phosphate dehydrogenase PdxA [Psychromarinibacter sp. C21-152]|uniref:4-hydroxythreonine-4-phosphate dehydrogenase n=1 Tax=Psychromarinibacter sediminicola TaxID=3033385 RepID=A0AAE3NUK7_9RHOB|nr:4-hydroxythreonine-4-phosphate dehydrogenase PdxA [Psychromarinibacter sediminicola]MDF0600887.1 4-hydroxythreonine-4-phosphate dehydrogenase PdxA [Psychromarinibacter sediminicola]
MTAPVALTAGEPAGIGPEIAVAAWDALRAGGEAFFWIGDPAHLPPGTALHEIADPAEAAAVFPDALPVLAHPFDGPATPGTANPAHAQGVIDVIARAVDLARSGAASAVCTCPIHKKALIDGAGFAYPGHTEYLAALAGVDRVVMMLASDQLRVVPTTIHIPVSAIPGALTAELLEATLRITHAALQRDFGLAAPRIAVAGLNPHAGEGGAMGHEDAALIAPILGALRDEGLDLTGPHPADTLFHAAARARYDACVAMYHDQALIPIKTLDFDRGVNVTLGLPFIRTSPDHGTAFDIAGTGAANPSSLIEALRLAHRMARTRSAAR